MTSRRAAAWGLLAGLFAIGFALMGFEMLGSRYLNPYFGSGITTWASLISVVLLAMMVGYFAGGYTADARPGVAPLAIAAAAAGGSVMLVAPLADTAMVAILRVLGDGFAGVLVASFALSFVPVALLSACSPMVVRLLLVDLASGGKTTGFVYSISTLGNVAGTLATTFVLIPNFGVRAITIAFGAFLVVLGAAFLLIRGRVESGLSKAVLALAMLAGAASLPAPAVAAPAAAVEIDAAYPEGPLWVGEQLLYAEMPLDRVMVWENGATRELWFEAGCGPTAISKFREHDYIVLCHRAAKLVQLDQTGRKLGEITATADGAPLQDPNDCHTDGAGGVFFSDPGGFSLEAPVTGRVMHLSPEKRLTEVVRGLRYANGVAYDPARRALYVSEHLAKKVWRYTLDEADRVVARELLLDVAAVLDSAELEYPLAGPDGIEIDPAGNILVPVYGSGRVVVVLRGGGTRKFSVAMRFVTNVAVSASRMAVVGAFVNDRAPFPGRVEVRAPDDAMTKN